MRRIEDGIAILSMGTRMKDTSNESLEKLDGAGGRSVGLGYNDEMGRLLGDLLGNRRAELSTSGLKSCEKGRLREWRGDRDLKLGKLLGVKPTRNEVNRR